MIKLKRCNTLKFFCIIDDKGNMRGFMITDVDRKIEYILDYFDFVKVQKVMECLDWKWRDSPDTPTIPELRIHAREQLREVVANYKKDRSYKFVICGGFKSSIYDEEPDGDIVLELEFVVTEWDSCYYK